MRYGVEKLGFKAEQTPFSRCVLPVYLSSSLYFIPLEAVFATAQLTGFLDFSAVFIRTSAVSRKGRSETCGFHSCNTNWI